MLKNSPRWSIEVNTTLGRRNNRSYVQIQVNSVENREKQQHRFNRCPGIGASDAWRKFRRPVGLSLWMQAEIKSTISIAPIEPMVKKISTGALDVLCSREHVLVDLNSPSAPVEPTLQNQAPVHWIYYVPESLFELISEPLQHRLNRCPYGACTGAMTQAWILCQKPQQLLIGHRETG